jgi:hypothetical protein
LLANPYFIARRRFERFRTLRAVYGFVTSGGRIAWYRGLDFRSMEILGFTRFTTIARGACVDQGKPRVGTSRILVVVPNTAQELLTASTRQQVLSCGGDRTSARGRLGVSKLDFKTSRIGWLVDPRAPDERVLVTGIKHFERRGTRLHRELGEGPVPEGACRSLPLSPKGGERMPSRTRTGARTSPRGDLGEGTERFAGLYSRRDRLPGSGPRERLLVGLLPSKPGRH